MNETGLPDRVRDFIVRHITSLEQVEVLLLLAGDPAKKWTIRQLVKEIRSSPESMGQRLRQLHKDGFVKVEGETFQFAGSPEISASIQELSVVYRTYPVRVIELIYSRTGALKNFADAFRFKPRE